MYDQHDEDGETPAKAISKKILDLQSELVKLIASNEGDRELCKDSGVADHVSRDAALYGMSWIVRAIQLQILQLDEMEKTHPDLYDSFIRLNSAWPVWVDKTERKHKKSQLPVSIHGKLNESSLGESPAAWPKGLEDTLGAELKLMVGMIFSARSNAKDRFFYEHIKKNNPTLLGSFFEVWGDRDFRAEIYALPAPDKSIKVLGKYAELIFDLLFSLYEKAHEDESVVDSEEECGRVIVVDGEEAHEGSNSLRYDDDFISERIKLYKDQGEELVEPPNPESEFYVRSSYIYTLLHPFYQTDIIRKETEAKIKLTQAWKQNLKGASPHVVDSLNMQHSEGVRNISIKHSDLLFKRSTIKGVLNRIKGMLKYA